MIIYGASISPFVRKVLFSIGEMGLETEHKPVSPHVEDADFRAASPLGKIPAMQDGDYCLADSSAIVHYLEAKHGLNKLLPVDAKARGKVIWFEEYADTVMFAAGTLVFVNRVLFPKIQKREGDEALAAKVVAEQIPPIFDYLEEQLQGREFLVGDSLSLADIAVTSMLVNYEHSDVAIDSTKYPQLKVYYERNVSRPTVSEIVAGEREFLASL
jgi:glutathione S-transferase